MTLRSHERSTTGRRESNQDRTCVEHILVGGKAAVLLAVADGMGGMSDGEQAAALAIDEIRSFSRNVLPTVEPSVQAMRDALVSAFQAANMRVWEYGRQQQLSGHVGTTLVCALVLEHAYLVANAGDSRCYYVNNHDTRALTEDQTKVQELVRTGAMTADAARRSPFRNELTNCLGEPNPIPVDTFPVAPHVGVIDEPCALLLCSDGLHGEVGDADLYAQLHGTRSLEQGCDNLLSLAFQRGSTDNISVAVVEVGRLARRGRRQTALPSVEVLRETAGAAVVRGVDMSSTGRRRHRELVPAMGALALAVVLSAIGGWMVWRPSQKPLVTPKRTAGAKTTTLAAGARGSAGDPLVPLVSGAPAAAARSDTVPAISRPASAWEPKVEARIQDGSLVVTWQPYRASAGSVKYGVEVFTDAAQNRRVGGTLTADRPEGTWSGSAVIASPVLYVRVKVFGRDRHELQSVLETVRVKQKSLPD